MIPSTGLPSLYLIADRATCGARDLEPTLEAALEAGVRLVQLREKALGPGELTRLAERVLGLTEAHGARLLINTHAQVAGDIGADGVHLPASGPPPEQIRSQFGEPFLVGFSAHNLSELARAASGGADFVTYSPVYSPGSKPAGAALVGLPGLREAVRTSSLPVYALGGVTPERTPGCRESGAYGVAVMSGILAAEDVGGAVVSYLAALGGTET